MITLLYFWMMKKIIALASLMFLLAVSPVCIAQGYDIAYTVTGLAPGKSYLLSIKGSRYQAVDSCIVQKQLIRFSGNKTLPVGVYRIVFGDSLFSDIILNNEKVVMKNNIGFLYDSLKVISSDETRIYYDYWRASFYINDSVNTIAMLGDAIYKANKGVMTPDLDSMARKAWQLTENLKNYTNALISQSQGMYVSKLLKAYAHPDWQTYKTTAGAKNYRNSHEFLKEHYFDNIDFTDSTLLNSEVFFVSCNDYLGKYVDNPSVESYTKAVDLILSKAPAGGPVYEYLLNLLVHTFENTELEAVFIHLVDNYLLANTCENENGNEDVKQKAAVLKKLKPGNPAPDFIAADTSGNTFKLYQLNARATLLLFWSSSCEHCEEAMPQLLDVYKTYAPYGLQVVAFAADTSSADWRRAIQKNAMNWINVSDLKGFLSPVINMYYAYSTPSFVLLNQDKTIFSRPYSPRQLTEGIESLLKPQ